MKIGRPPKYIYNIGDIIEDFECIDIIKDEKNHTRYVMKCTKCGKIKYMLGSTIAAKKGMSHKSCGKGLGITHDKAFYTRWQGMRERTSIKSVHREQYYDRGINSDAFASFIDFYNALYPSWLEHIKRFGVADTSLERIDVDKSYTPENCTWVCLDEQKGNMQKTRYFKTENLETGEISYHKNARQYAHNNHINEKYIYDILKYQRVYNGIKYTPATKEEYAEYNLQNNIFK